jgi:DNA integrity scanning protein DisA with diadenylate cyclase activity
MSTELMLQKGIELAEAIHAVGVIAFLPRTPYSSSVEVFWADEGYLDIWKDLTMHQALESVQQHIRDAAVQVSLEKDLTEGTLVGVFSHAILVYSIEDAAGMIDLESFGSIVSKPVMKAALTLAMEIGAEGREGRAVGTAFIIGDGDLILANSHQLILNPYWGHPREITSVMKRENWESVKEFAQLDGIFVIDRDGSVLAAGRYMDVDSRSVTLPGGLGGRHRAVAAITKLLPVAGIIISESGGIVRLYRNGVCQLSLRSDVSIPP